MSDHWDAEAACRGMDTELWFNDSSQCVARAKGICSVCPVQATCMEEAIKRHAKGIWGGTTDIERDRIRRSRRVSDPSRRKTKCQKGHEFTPENTYLRPNGDRQCRVCTKARKREKAEQRPPRQAATHCKRGHEWRTETTYFDPRGVRVCRVCRSITQRARKEQCRGAHRPAVT